MRLLLNLIWLLLAGFWLFLEYVAFGLLLCITVVGIPAGMMMFRLAGYVLWPFGRTVIAKPGAGAGSVVLNILWILTFGLALALSHLVTALFQALTIIGIPLAVANIKMVPMAFAPFGHVVVPAQN